MMLIALFSLAVSPAQDGGIPYRAPVYVPPVVRPFEPPSDFGRVIEEGDGRGDPRRRQIERPVVVEAYSGSYEYAPSTAEQAYNQGVAQAEQTMDDRMGPLDGLWRIRDASGAVLLSLVLTDAGDAAPLEGAWRKDIGGSALGTVEQVSRSESDITLGWAGASLRLRRSSDAWVGELIENGRTQGVSLTR